MNIYSTELNETQAEQHAIQNVSKQPSILIALSRGILMFLWILIIIVIISVTITNYDAIDIDEIYIMIPFIAQLLISILSVLIYYAYEDTSTLILVAQILINFITLIVSILQKDPIKAKKRENYKKIIIKSLSLYETIKKTNYQKIIITSVFCMIVLIGLIFVQYKYYINKDNQIENNANKATFFSLNLKFVKYQQLSGSDFIITYILATIMFFIFTWLTIVTITKTCGEDKINNKIGKSQFQDIFFIYTPMLILIQMSLFIEYYSKDSIVLTIFIILLISMIEILTIVLYYLLLRKLITKGTTNETVKMDTSITAIILLIIVSIHTAICYNAYKDSISDVNETTNDLIYQKNPSNQT